jgi:carboxylate-amine ligase
VTDPASIHLFQAYGVELEYMIVDRETLSVLPITDKVLYEVAGEYLSEVEMGELAWSNELALHVIELKTNGPAPRLDPLPQRFQDHVHRINTLLVPMGARLMPTAMHPWMDPHRELKLWPHQYNIVYEAYNRIFDCRGHGWANLQSVHLNLPFAGDEEFGSLHAAIRLLLPIMPALAASSPVVERRLSKMQDTRLDVYRSNASQVPSLSGQVVPEPAFTRADYERSILQRIYDDIAPFDPAGTLQHEWLNSRGAIARFDRNTIEIRVLDVQECPLADLAICQAIAAVLQALTQQRWTSTLRQQGVTTEPLAEILGATTQRAERAVIRDRLYLEQFGCPADAASAQELWQHLIEQVLPAPGNSGEPAPFWQQPLQTILQQGPLARRITTALGGDPSERLELVYRELCDCLSGGRMFLP